MPRLNPFPCEFTIRYFAVHVFDCPIANLVAGGIRIGEVEARRRDVKIEFRHGSRRVYVVVFVSWRWVSFWTIWINWGFSVVWRRLKGLYFLTFSHGECSMKHELLLDHTMTQIVVRSIAWSRFRIGIISVTAMTKERSIDSKYVSAMKFQEGGRF